MTDLDAALACEAIYGSLTGFDRWVDAGGVVAGIKYIPEGTLVAFRGSLTLEDWARDLEAMPVDPISHPQLGYVHRGFLEGLDDFLGTAAPLVQGQTFLAGHSLGAARAALVAGILTSAGKPPARLTLFGCPRVSLGSDLARLLACVPAASYRHLCDPVTELPLMFSQPLKLQQLVTTPAALDPVDDHFIAGYVKAIEALQISVARSSAICMSKCPD